jgi:hypothetical protein
VSTHPIRTYRDVTALAPRRPRRPSAASVTILRLRVALRHGSLDSALARGADPGSRPELAVRATQLERPRHRRTLARTLRRAVGEATGPRPAARPAAVVIARKEILAHASDLLELAVRLDCPFPADPAGIAIAHRLVTDAVASPLYAGAGRSALNQLCRHAITEMGDPYA